MEEDRYTRITLRIPKDLHSQLQQAADDTSKSMNAEIVARLQDSFGAQPLQFTAPKRDWAERFNLYRLEAQIDSLGTQSALLSMQIKMLDSQLDQLAYRRASDAEMFGPKKELEAAKELQRKLVDRLAEIRSQYRKQQALADEAAREELLQMNNAIDRELEDDLRAVHELEKKLAIPAEKRTVVLKPAPKKPSL